MKKCMDRRHFIKATAAGGGGLEQCKLPAELLPIARRYTWSLPDSALTVIGMSARSALLENIEAAVNFAPLSDEERAALESVGRAWAESWGEHLGSAE
jgi:predicted aldo/keto reductase-like oxidoreductase